MQATADPPLPRVKGHLSEHRLWALGHAATAAGFGEPIRALASLLGATARAKEGSSHLEVTAEAGLGRQEGLDGSWNMPCPGLAPSMGGLVTGSLNLLKQSLLLLRTITTFLLRPWTCSTASLL